MIPIKLQCVCGQKYAFDAQPVNGRMPHPVRCPVCGADGTARANEIIAGTLAAETPPSPASSVQTPAAPTAAPIATEAPQAGMKKSRAALWMCACGVVVAVAALVAGLIGWNHHSATSQSANAVLQTSNKSQQPSSPTEPSAPEAATMPSNSAPPLMAVKSETEPESAGQTNMAAGTDWPQWRGPDRNGVARESPPLADQWPAAGPRLVWQAEKLMHGGSDTGHGSPAVAGGCVYLYENWLDAKSEGGADDAVACLNASNGTVLWRSVFPADKEAGVREQGSTPCVQEGRLYVAGRRKVYCLDAATGKLIWQQAVDYKGNGVSCSLALVDGIAIFICRGFYGFDALTGIVRWHRSEEPGNWNSNGTWGSYPSAVVWRHNGKNYVVCSCRNVELMDPATGHTIWQIPWVEGGWSSWNGNSSPSIVGDLMVINQKSGGFEAYTLSLEAPAKLWHIPDHDVATSPLLYQGSLYTVGGGDYNKTTSIRCADLRTGAVTWEQSLKPQGASSPLAADGKIFGFVEFGQLLCMWKADPDKYTPLGTATVKADGYSSMAFAVGRLFLRLADGLACYDLTLKGNPGGSRAAAQEALEDKRQELEDKRRELQASAVKANQDAADKGDSYGQLRMGQRYRDGDGVAKDMSKAREYFAKAAAQGDTDAARALENMNADKP
jgi:outer membrane protein assembly factor BamB